MGLYEQVVAEVSKFLPSDKDVEHFVARQCQAHLHIEPAALSAAHIPQLAWWIGVSTKLLIPEQQALFLQQRIESLK